MSPLDRNNPESPRFIRGVKGSRGKAMRVTPRRKGNPIIILQGLYPQPSGEETFHRHCSDTRSVYNLVLESRNLWRRGRVQKVNTVTQMRELAEARKAFDWLALG